MLTQFAAARGEIVTSFDDRPLLVTDEVIAAALIDEGSLLVGRGGTIIKTQLERGSRVHG